MNRLDGSSDPTSSDASTISKNELESALPLKGRTYILEQRMLKGNNRYVDLLWYFHTLYTVLGMFLLNFLV